MLESIRIADKTDPIVIVEFLRVPTDAEFDEYIAHLDSRLKRQSTTVYVFDARRAGSTAEQARRQGAWMKANRDAIRRNTKGTAFVIDSAIVRFGLSLVFAVQSMPCPYYVSTSIDEAIRWARGLVQPAGIRESV